ncbi:17.8 kDa class I heat shock protein [Senna tora]|uniref:17.8 kDa class I heat shock protein n=1 Tax=Senna tora TaxID=362788 RepID=A0A834SVJ0_9FABA|nr:17.8 kDa class I heat shock protein [Senna tora]
MKSDDGGFWKIGKLFRKKKEKDRDCGRSVNGGGFDVFKVGLEHVGLGRLLPVDAGVGDGCGLRGEVGARAGDDGPGGEVVEGGVGGDVFIIKRWMSDENGREGSGELWNAQLKLKVKAGDASRVPNCSKFW